MEYRGKCKRDGAQGDLLDDRGPSAKAKAGSFGGVDPVSDELGSARERAEKLAG
jgi:hypothetical protein